MTCRIALGLAVFSIFFGSGGLRGAESPVRAGGSLTLQEAMRWVMEHNFALQVQEKEVLIAQDGIDRARGEFDPRAFVSSTREDNIRKLNALDFSSFGLAAPDPTRSYFNESNFRNSAGVSGRLPTGTQYELMTSFNRLDNDVNRAGRFFSPEFETFTGLTLTQPLLKDFWLKPNLAELRAARLEVQVAERTREIELVNKLIEVANAYYDMVFGLENLRVKQDAVTVAQQLRTENQERVRLGRMTEIDITQADVKVSEAREELILGEDFLRERRVRLLKLLLTDFAGATIPEFNATADLAVPVAAAQGDLVTAALARRPDFLLAQAEAGKNRFLSDRARNQRLPQLDLRLSYGLGGLDDNFSDSYRDITDNQRRMSAAVVASVPIGNRRAAAESRTAQRRLEQADLAVTELRTAIGLEVTNAVQRIETLRRRLDTAVQSRQFASDGLTVERARLDAGQTTSFNVLELQQKLSDARTRELAARVDLKKAEAELWGATGVFLDRHGFTNTAPTGN